MNYEEEHSYCFKFKSFRLDVEERQLFHNGVAVPLEPKVFDVLAALVQRSGHLVKKDELLHLIWSDSFVEEANIARTVYTLRKVLGEDENGNKFIETVAKKGYRFVAKVNEIHGPPAAKSSNDKPSSLKITDTPTGGESQIPAVESETERIAPITHSRPLISALTTDPDAFVLSAKWSPDEEMKAERNGSIEHVEPSAEFLQAVEPIRAPKIFRRSVLLGVLLLASSAVIVYLLFIPSAPLNSEKFSPKNSITDPSRSPAYDLYVRGKVKVGSENREDTEAAIKVLEEAVAIDPNFAEAFVQLARGYNTMAFKYTSDSERKRFHENAEVAIEKALALNPDLAEAHFARGLILWTNTKGFPHEQAIQSYKRSLALDQNLDETHHQLSLVYSHIGLLDEAQQSVKNALEINPNNTLARFRAGVYNAYQGKFDEAIGVFKTIPRDVTPLLVDRSIAEALIQTGRLNEAEAIVDDHLSRYPQDEGGSFTSVKALLLAKAGRQKEAKDAITRAVEIGNGYGHFHHTAYNVASAYAFLNKPDEAVKWLEVTAESGFPNYPYFEIDPNLNSVRKDQRFIVFMSKLKMQWERFKALS